METYDRGNETNCYWNNAPVKKRRRRLDYRFKRRALHALHVKQRRRG